MKKGLSPLAKKLLGIGSIILALSGPASCIAGECDGEIDTLVAAGRAFIGKTDPMHRFSGCVDYFIAWGSVGKCMGQDTDIPTGVMINAICTRLAGGEGL